MTTWPILGKKGPPCPFCDGTGVKPGTSGTSNSPMLSCGKFGGVGRVIIRSGSRFDSIEYMDCSLCKGLGWIWRP